jgi:E3 ubiquitin-protein ligase MARCH6
MGLTEYLLPRSIEKFQLVGTKNIFLPQSFNIDCSNLPAVTPTVDKVTGKEVDHFWYELVKKEKGIDYFIESNLQHAILESTCKFVDGESKGNGERVLAHSADFIRLPELSSGEETLLPTKISRFRLKRAISDDLSNSVIEFWKEVPGEETPRPPEGWDDLGAGGAFVQGRWAWGKERKSVIEGSVAQPTPFRDAETERRPIHLMLRVVSLLLFSWFAITITVLGIISAPLAVGRSCYYLFRIPKEYVHDPLAFCIGGCLFFPMMSLLVKTINLTEGDPVQRFRHWLSRFHLPPRQKFLVFLESFLLWAGVAPMALGISYEVFAVKTSKWFAREEPVADMHSLLLCWMVGAGVINTWAFLAYFSVFTKEFWASIGNGILEPPLDENGAGEVARNNANVGNRAMDDIDEEEDDLDDPYRGWQGKRGRVARFFNVWRAVFFDWEWDAVDRVKLLEEFARPITKQLASALVGSSLSFQFSLYLVPLLARFEQGSIVGKYPKWLQLSFEFFEQQSHQLLPNYQSLLLVR